MSHWKTFGPALFIVVSLLSEANASDTAGCYLQGCATEWSAGEIITSEACQAPRKALPLTSTTPDR